MDDLSQESTPLIPTTPVLRVRSWAVHPNADFTRDEAGGLPDLQGERAAYTLGLGSEELHQAGFPPYSLLRTQRLEHPNDVRAVASLTGTAPTARQRWYRVNAYDFAFAQNLTGRMFDPGDGKRVRQLEWSGLDAWFTQAAEVSKQKGLLYLLFCVEEEPRINFVVKEELGATLRDKDGNPILTREGLRAGMEVTAYTDDLLTVHHDEAHGFFLGGKDSVMMTLVFAEGRGWHVGVVGNLSGVKRLELHR